MESRLKNLKDVMGVQTISYNVKLMNKYIKDFVKNVPDCTIYKNHGNLYVTRGEADLYPCVVAHTDTVHDMHKAFTIQRHKDVLYAINERYERVGIGGDDKVGVYVALEILRTTPVCKVAFFRDEEVGCVGSKLADMSFFEDVSLVLQCDRQGYADFVNNIFYSDMYGDEFGDAMSDLLVKYDRVESDGGMTDVWQLTENGLGVACANMSCGYYDPHTDNEFIIISQVFRTLDFVEEIIESLGDRKWVMKPEDREKDYSWGGGYGNYGNYGGHKDTDTYRRYGREKNYNTYDEYVDVDDDVDTKDDDKWKKDYLVDADCSICTGTEVCYDDTVDLYWCFGCQDYIREEMLDFPTTETNQKLINAYVDLNDEEKDDVPF